MEGKGGATRRPCPAPRRATAWRAMRGPAAAASSPPPPSVSDCSPGTLQAELGELLRPDRSADPTQVHGPETYSPQNRLLTMHRLEPRISRPHPDRSTPRDSAP